MALRYTTRFALGCGLAATLALGAPSIAARQAPALGVDTARVTLNGTSNIHAYTASTTAVRITRVQFANTVPGPTFWDEVTKPGGLTAFEVAIPAATLASPKEGLDKNMHKALKTQEHPEITFRLTRTEAGATAGTLKALGVLRIAGVEREVILPLKLARSTAGTLTVKGELPLLMTDYGIKAPVAMLGMLKTDPKVTVVFETVLSVPLT